MREAQLKFLLVTAGSVIVISFVYAALALSIACWQRKLMASRFQRMIKPTSVVRSILAVHVGAEGAAVELGRAHLHEFDQRFLEPAMRDVGFDARHRFHRVGRDRSGGQSVGIHHVLLRLRGGESRRRC